MTSRRIIRAHSFGPPEVMQLEVETIPAIGDGEVLIAVDSIGVNFADTLLRSGRYRRGQRLPYTPGLEAAGWTVSAQPEVALDPGTPVVAFLEGAGGYAEYVVAPAHRTYALPKDVSLIDAATVFLQGLTAWYALHRYGKVGPGDWVLVHAGAGGVGGLAIQLAKIAGASVVACVSTEEKLSRVLEHGADIALIADPATVADQVRGAIGPSGCDVVIDGVGGPLFAASLEALAHGGRYVVVGSASQQSASLDARRLMPRAQTISGFILARVFEQSSEEPTRALAALFDLLRQGKLRLVRTVLDLESAVDAHRLIESRRHVGKIVLRP